MNAENFRREAHRMVDWMADYLQDVEKYPVRSQVSPREIFDQLPDEAPVQGEEMSVIFQDFEKIILPGITHWQSPNFYAYFPANASPPSLLAEMLTATLGAQCMIWETSPAAAELEEKVTGWLGKLIGIPAEWSGVIQSTASESTLCALLSARERASQFSINESGFSGKEKFRVYGSSQTHSSIEKGLKIAGLGSDSFVKVPVDDSFAMNPELLRLLIHSDIKEGHTPLAVVASLGTTGSTAMDSLEEIAAICQEHHIWLHVDAAYAGSAFILPEYQHYMKGIEHADSFVFNPHKWLYTHFDCSLYYVKNPELLVRTFEILPEYLKTQATHVNNYRDWGIPLGRRFRALKLWFVLRSYGVEGLQAGLREHMRIAKVFYDLVEQSPDFEILAPLSLNLVCFRYTPSEADPAALDALNESLVHRINQRGHIYLTHTRLRGAYTLRMAIGQVTVEERHVRAAWEEIQGQARELRP